MLVLCLGGSRLGVADSRCPELSYEARMGRAVCVGALRGVGVHCSERHPLVLTSALAARVFVVVFVRWHLCGFSTLVLLVTLASCSMGGTTGSVGGVPCA